MRVFLSSSGRPLGFGDVLEAVFRSAGLDFNAAPTPAPHEAASPQQRAEHWQARQAAERQREQRLATLSASIASYLEHRVEVRSQISRPADPQSIARELAITTRMSRSDLNRLRRTFALENHPDRVPTDERENATRRMMIANMLIDGEMKRRGQRRPPPIR